MALTDVSGRNFKWDLMISYCWAQQELVLKIKEKLEEKGFTIWFDEEQVAKYKSLPEAMGYGISNATAVLLCISPDYEKSLNCEREAHFASSEKKALFFVKVTENYQPTEPWLKFLMGDCLYFVIPSFEKLNLVFEQLELAIRRVVSPEKSSIISDKPSSPSEQRETSLVISSCKRFYRPSFENYSRTELLADYGELDFNPYKVTSLYDKIYAVKKDNNESCICLQLRGTELGIQKQKSWSGFILDLCTNNSGLYALILQEGDKFLWECDLDYLELFAMLPTELVSSFGGWFITGVGERLLLMVSYDGKDEKDTNLIHEFVEGNWKRQLTLPNDKFLKESSVVQIKATEGLLLINAIRGLETGEVWCYKWPKSSSKINGKCWSVSLNPLSLCILTSSGFVLSRLHDCWQLVDAKQYQLELTTFAGKNRPVIGLMGDAILSRYKVGKSDCYCLMQLKA